jgi:hypothetical protein
MICNNLLIEVSRKVISFSVARVAALNVLSYARTVIFVVYLYFTTQNMYSVK